MPHQQLMGHQGKALTQECLLVYPLRLQAAVPGQRYLRPTHAGVVIEALVLCCCLSHALLFFSNTGTISVVCVGCLATVVWRVLWIV